VTRTKGKGAKGVQKTTTTNDELPGEEFAEGKQKENMQRAVQRCRETVARLVGSHGRADPAVLEGVRVSLPSSEPPKAPTKNRQEAGPTVSIKELATIGVRDGALLVTCFDPSTLKYVERGIYNAELGLAPQHVTDGGEEGVLRVPIPRPTAESRAQLLKDVNNVCENARVSIRVARQTAKKQIDSDVKRKVIGKDESHLEMGRIEEETKNRTAEVNKIQEDTRKRLER
jgi:ribosome recycling factor